MKTSKQPAPRSLLPTSYFLLLVILLLAAALRFYHLDAQSFWNDEGNSARIAERTLDLILEGAAGDIHPPGYYLLLHYWRALFGQSEFALRSLSVVAGLVLIVFTYLLGRHLFGEVTGLMAAFLGAISPFAIYYSQEARMYALLAAASAASTYLLLRLLVNDVGQKPGFFRKTWFLAYVLTTTAGLYIQYAFSFVLLVHNSIFGLWWLAMARRSVYRGRCHREYHREYSWRGSWRWLVVWAGTQAVIVALYLPWLPIALRSLTGWSAAGRAYELGRALLDVLRVLSVGTTLPAGEATVALAGVVVLLLVGLWPVLLALPPRVPPRVLVAGLVAVSKVEGRSAEWPRRDDRVGWLGVASIALYLLLPIILIFAFDLYKPAWLKFLVVVLPPFYLLLAHGVENLTSLTLYALRNTQYAMRGAWCVVRGICYVSLLAALLPSLHNLYFNPAYVRDDYRQIATDVAAALRPGDAIILDAPNQWEVFTYYYPDQDVYPAPYRPGPARAEAFLTPLIERHRRLFVLYWGDAESDPRRLIETWLAAHTYKASDIWYGRVRLATYGVAPLPEEPAIALDARFGEAIRLSGYALAGDLFAPGDILPVTLFWETLASIPERYKVTIQLLDGAGQLVTQVDTEPGDGLALTTTWYPGQVLADRYGVPLPADLPSGRYPLIVGLYHTVSGERLPVILDGEPVGDHLSLGSVEVLPAR